MTRFLLPLAAAGLLFTGAAFAEEYRGTIERVDEDARVVIIDGYEYQLPADLSARAYVPGMSVRVVYDEVGDTRVISRLSTDDNQGSDDG